MDVSLIKIINDGIDAELEIVVNAFNRCIEQQILVRKGVVEDNEEWDEFAYCYPKNVIILQARESKTKEPRIKEYTYVQTILRGVLHTILHPDTLNFRLTHRKEPYQLINIVMNILGEMGCMVTMHDNKDLLIDGKKFFQVAVIISGKFVTELGSVIMKHKPDILENVLEQPELSIQKLTCSQPDGLIAGLEEIVFDFDRDNFLEELIKKIEKQNWNWVIYMKKETTAENENLINKLTDKLNSYSNSIAEEYDIMMLIEESIRDVFSCDLDCSTCTPKEQGQCMQAWKKANLYLLRKMALDETKLMEFTNNILEMINLVQQTNDFLNNQKKGLEDETKDKYKKRFENIKNKKKNSHNDSFYT